MIVMTAEIFILLAVSLALILLILFIWRILIIIKTSKKLKNLNNQRIKRKSSKRKKHQQIKIVRHKRQRSIKQAILLVVLFVMTSGAAGYSRFYQLTNLATNDSESIVKGYYLVAEASKQLELDQQTGEKEQVDETNYQHTAIQLASYAPKKADTYGSKEGQLALNKYYRQLGQLGINMSSQSYAELGASDTLQNSFFSDIQRIESIQKEVIDLYKINEESLKKAFKGSQ